MNNFTQIFQRVEKKYLLTEYQYFALRRFLEGTARVDRYGETSILNIYYDTPDFRLIRASLDGPAYKEKLRLRSYGVPADDSTAFLEIKKKYQGIVYKRRIDMPYRQAADYLAGGGKNVCGGGTWDRKNRSFDMVPEGKNTCCGRTPEGKNNTAESDCQIRKEIEWFFRIYPGLGPRMAVCYDRIALEGITDPDFRVTFDRNITWRTKDLDLEAGNSGKRILEPGTYLMELKILGAVDPALSGEMSRLGIFPVGFSKYGQGFLAMQREWMTQDTGRRRYTVPAPEFLHPAASAAV